ncbi:MAG: glutamine-hydrolyzing GMP synthase [Thaumarchaeota archaeon]|nr:glutamine-hydrolyzing GMP synthase [Nitrososphaerota archaeon]
MPAETADRIVVLDFGSQYSHLICRRIRDFSVRAELLPFDAPAAEVRSDGTRGIILSGGPASTYEEGAPMPQQGILESGLPVLGICYGHQVIVTKYGGRVRRVSREYGPSTLTIDDGSGLLAGIGPSTRAWMSHGDEAEEIPESFHVIGHTEGAAAAAISDGAGRIFGIQFHPEVAHTPRGTDILRNFAVDICGARQEWTMEAFVERSVRRLSEIPGRILCGVSGGIDSSVAAALLHRAAGDRLQCIFVDNGLLRHQEASQVADMFSGLGVNFDAVDASASFLAALEGVDDPEAKRKIIGEEFVRAFTRYSQEKGPFRWLAQGTLYPDVIESGVSGGPAAVIKSHHNVGGLPDWLGLEVLEPLRDLYKDEVRNVGRILGLPERFLSRHPFPGPGLGVRVMGEVTPEKLRICREASHIVEEELDRAGLYDSVWQAYAAVGDDRAVGVVGDFRLYGYVVMIRVVESVDAMTADWARLDHSLLGVMSSRITNEVEGVAWVTYAISSKPPATIEPQ